MAGHSDTEHDSANGTRRQFLKSTGVAGALVGGLGAELWLLQGDQSQGAAETFLLGGRIEGWQGVAPEAIAGTTNPTLTLEAGQTYQLLWQNQDGAAHNFEIRDSSGNALQVLVPVGVDQQSAQQQFEQPGQGSPANESSGNASGSPATATAQPTTDGMGTANETAGAGGGETISTTELVTQQGAVQAVQFTASEEMAEYICPVHPTSMVGDIELSGGSAAGNNSTSG